VQRIPTGLDVAASTPQSVTRPASVLPEAVARKTAEVDALVQHAVDGKTDGLLLLRRDLMDLAKGARAEHPLLAKDDKKAQAVAEVCALANRIQLYAALTAGGCPPEGVAVEACAQALKLNAAQLSPALEAVYAPTSVAAPATTPAPGGLLPMVDVPAGPFQFGIDNAVQETGPYRISKYPVTNEQFAAFVEATGYEPKGSWHGGEAEQRPDHPVTNVTFFDAKAFCKWVGGRLPSEQEWEKAARGTDGRAYPWGNGFDPNKCNNDGTGTTPVTAYERAGNVSPFGAVDMVGNVLEWVDGETPRRAGAVLLKGGAWTNYATPKNQPFDAVRHTSESPESSYRGFGFRVAMDAIEQPRSSGLPRAQGPALEPPPAALDLGWQLADAPRPAAQQPPVTAPLPEDIAERTRGVRSHVESAIFRGDFDQDWLMADLDRLAESARNRHPLSGAVQDRSTHEAIATVNSAANRIALYAGFAASGMPPHGMGMEACEKFLSGSLDDLEKALGTVYAAPLPEEKPAGARGDLIDWVRIPDGEYIVGYDNRKVGMPGFEISKYPVTNAQFNEFVDATGYRTEGGWHPMGQDFDDHPVVNVTYYDAKAFCEWAGGRLPKELEWEAAARGPQGARLPWGDAWRPEAVFHEAAGTVPVTASEKAGNVSPHGMADAVGNVLEWVDDPSPSRPGSVLLKGGAWSNGGLKPFNAARHTSEIPDGAYRGFGFRIARNLPDKP